MVNYSVKRYNSELLGYWNSFIKESKNATFLLDRNYMDYHKHRFADYSLMVYNGNELIALLPLNIVETEVYSHQGLTYGGFVFGKNIRIKEAMECVYSVLKYLEENGIEKLNLKLLPDFYTTMPADDIKYILWMLDAENYRMDTAMSVFKGQELNYQERRKRSINKSKKMNPEIKSTGHKEFEVFWENILEPNLMDRYGVKPVHTLEEILCLYNYFPENIRQYNVYVNGKIMAGATIYSTDYVSHAQYISGSPLGRAEGHLDYLFDYLIKNELQIKNVFDLGICNEENGRNFNQGLLDWKEGFGGRACIHYFYSILPASKDKLLHHLNYA